MTNVGTASTSNDSAMSACVSASTCRPVERPDLGNDARTSLGRTYLEDEHLRVLLRELEHNLVHLLARRGPWCPEVDERDALEVLGEEALKVLRGLHIVEVRWDSSCHFFVRSFD